MAMKRLAEKFKGKNSPADKFRRGEFGADQVRRITKDMFRMRVRMRKHEQILKDQELGDRQAPMRRFIMEIGGQLYSVRPKVDSNATSGIGFSFALLDDDPDTEE